MNNIIPIVFVPGAKGHQIGRLLASCDNVVWYDHFKNGDKPWIPAMGMDMGNISKYHFDRRFRGARGEGIDEFTVPPVLDMAERNQYTLDEEQSIKLWSEKLSPNYFVYPLHSELDQSKRLFQNIKHLVVLTQDIDGLVDRFIKTTANFVYSYNDPEKKTFYEYFKQQALTIDYRDWIRSYVVQLLENYRSNLGPDDFVINDVQDLLDLSRFKQMCLHFNLEFNESNYYKVCDLVRDDAFTPYVVTKKLQRKDMSMLNDFCNTCLDLGYTNNGSLTAMKFTWCLQENGSWWATIKNDRIISISGVHQFRDGWRAVFRGAQTETRPIQGLNKYQMQSYCIHSQLPLQIEYAESISGKDTPIYITTNTSNDASGRMSRIDRSFAIMAQGGMVEHCGKENIYEVDQNIWRLNKNRYFDLRR